MPVRSFERNLAPDVLRQDVDEQAADDPRVRACGCGRRPCVGSGRVDPGDVAGVVGEQRPLVAEHLERPLDVGGGDRLAVRPLRLRVELEGDRLLVVGDRPALRDPGGRRQVLRVEVDQEIPVHRPDVVVLLVEADERVQRLRVLRPSRSAGCSRPSSSCPGRPAGDRRRRPPRPATRERDRDRHALASRRPPPPEPRASSRRRRAAPGRPSGIVAMCLPWPTGTLAIAGIPSGAISSSSISSIDRVDSEPSGAVRPCRLTSVPKTKPGDVVELAGADQVVEQRCRPGTRSVFRSSTISTQPSVSSSNGRPELGAQQGQAATDQRRLGGSAADREHVRVLRILEHAAERLAAGRLGETTPWFPS